MVAADEVCGIAAASLAQFGRAALTAVKDRPDRSL
jgi:hypothetical protein